MKINPGFEISPNRHKSCIAVFFPAVQFFFSAVLFFVCAGAQVPQHRVVLGGLGAVFVGLRFVLGGLGVVLGASWLYEGGLGGCIGRPRGCVGRPLGLY